ncbi:MAG: translin family protein [Actinobacteria bacterium]|nr:translin family protein [Actinomycetota bacterium]
MSKFDSNLNNLSITFDKLNDIREQSLAISREIVRECSKSIRNIHRNDVSNAKEHIKIAQNKIEKLKNICSEISEISYAGYVLDAEREFVEAVLFYTFEVNGYIEPYKKFNVHPSSYIQGIGDTIGEWRRKALDHLRNLDIKKAETYLEIMEEGIGILNELDYPDALTGGLRRYADNARSIIERTRSDITNAFINEALRKDISNIDKNEL